jgi:hypothetical protein
LFEGSTNLGKYYKGVTFGPNARILDSMRSGGDYSSDKFPPHSGTAVLFAMGSTYLTATFARTTDHVEIWYTCDNTPLSFQAYDAADNLVASTSGAINVYQNNFLEVNAPNIKSVRISGAQGNFTIDNLGFRARVSTSHTLSSEFSSTSNPGNGWGFYHNSDLLSIYGPYPPIGDVWQWNDPNEYNLPIWFQTPSGGYSGYDLQAGEVCTHGGYPDHLSRVVWTSNMNGNVAVSGSVWQPRQPGYSRSMLWELYVNGILKSGGTLTDANNRNNRQTFATGFLPLQVGQTVVMTFPIAPTSQYPDMVGVDLTIMANPVVILPATGLLLMEE